MAEIEKIHKDDLLPLFTELKAEQSPLTMELVERHESHLCYIIDIRKRRRALHFIVKIPDLSTGFSRETPSYRIKFEFSDKERIKYVFKTDEWEVADGKIWVKFPDYLNRFQRRKLYRLEAPHGTRLYFKLNDIRYKLLVIDVSLGGTLGVLVSLTKQMEDELKLYNARILKDVELVFPVGKCQHAESLVKIKRCQIRRQQRNPQTHKFECAIEFLEISEQQQKYLTDLFYKGQREYLRRRKRMRA